MSVYLLKSFLESSSSPSSSTRSFSMGGSGSAARESNSYRAVECLGLACTSLEGLTLQPWKLNLIATYKDWLIAADGAQVVIYQIPPLPAPLEHLNACVKEPVHTLHAGHADINQIRTGMLCGNTPVLMTVNDVGEVSGFEPVVMEITNSCRFSCFSWTICWIGSPCSSRECCCSLLE